MFNFDMGKLTYKLMNREKDRMGNLLITGGIGYIGSHTVLEVANNYGCGFKKVIVTDYSKDSKSF